MHDEETREIPDEDVERISGGISVEGDAKAVSTSTQAWGSCPPCPNCGSKNTRPYPGFPGLPYACDDCQTAFG